MKKWRGVRGRVMVLVIVVVVFVIYVIMLANEKMARCKRTRYGFGCHRCRLRYP